jgi:hypothetical protein
LRVGKQVQGLSTLKSIKKQVTQSTHRHDPGTETITPGGGTKGVTYIGKVIREVMEAR